MTIESKEHNGHQAIKFEVHFSFVTPGGESGYQRIHVSMQETKEAAIVEGLTQMMGEEAPLAGIVVYERVFTC